MTDERPPRLDPSLAELFVANAHGDFDEVRERARGEPSSSTPLGLGRRRLGDRPRRGCAHGRA